METTTIDLTYIVDDLRKIQSNYPNFPKHFIYPKTVVKNAILFIGINPSADKNLVSLDSYQLDQKGNKHQYFKKFEDISNYCEVPWTHLDLLYFRETNQNTIHDILKQDNGVNFIWEQLKLTDKLIKDCNPKVIVVCNALAANFLGKNKDGENNKWLDYNLPFDENIGTCMLGNTPIFFSGMLSGQRALDKGSYERFKWHIKKVIIDLKQ